MTGSRHAYYPMGGKLQPPRTLNPMKSLQARAPATEIAAALPKPAAPPSKQRIAKRAPKRISRWVFVWKSRDSRDPRKLYDKATVIASVGEWLRQRATGRSKVFGQPLNLHTMLDDPFDGFILIVDSEHEQTTSIKVASDLAAWLGNHLGRNRVTFHGPEGFMAQSVPRPAAV